jgi:hypothetical protein
VQGDPDDVETLLDEPSCCDRRVDPSAHSDENAFASDHGPMVATAREDAAKTGIYWFWSVVRTAWVPLSTSFVTRSTASL